MKSLSLMRCFFLLLTFITNLAFASSLDSSLKTWILKPNKYQGGAIYGSAPNGCRAIIVGNIDYPSDTSGKSVTIVWNGIRGKFDYDNNITLYAQSDLVAYFNGHRAINDGKGTWYLDQAPVNFSGSGTQSITASLASPLTVITPSHVVALTVIVGGSTATCLEMNGSQYVMGVIGGPSLGFLALTSQKDIVKGASLDAWDVRATPKQWVDMGRLNCVRGSGVKITGLPSTRVSIAGMSRDKYTCNGEEIAQIRVMGKPDAPVGKTEERVLLNLIQE